MCSLQPGLFSGQHKSMEKRLNIRTPRVSGLRLTVRNHPTRNTMPCSPIPPVTPPTPPKRSEQPVLAPGLLALGFVGGALQDGCDPLLADVPEVLLQPKPLVSSLFLFLFFFLGGGGFLFSCLQRVATTFKPQDCDAIRTLGSRAYRDSSLLRVSGLGLGV